MVERGSTNKQYYIKKLSGRCDLSFWTDILQGKTRILSSSKEVIFRIVGENINIGLTTHPIHKRKQWVKSTLGQVDSIPKVVHVELATDSMEKLAHLITEVMK